MSKIVVGVDGSQGSHEALAWATSEALLRHAELLLVHGWQVPAPAALYVPPDAQIEEMATAVLDDAKATVERLVPEGEHLEVSTRFMPIGGAPALIEAAEGADLLVVGSRGHGAFAGLLLGSVSLHCASHAPCPVVVVRVAEEE